MVIPDRIIAGGYLPPELVEDLQAREGELSFLGQRVINMIGRYQFPPKLPDAIRAQRVLTFALFAELATSGRLDEVAGQKYEKSRRNPFQGERNGQDIVDIAIEYYLQPNITQHGIAHKKGISESQVEGHLHWFNAYIERIFGDHIEDVRNMLPKAKGDESRYNTRHFERSVSSPGQSQPSLLQ